MGSTSTVAKPTDIQVRGCAVYFLPIRNRVPLKFGTEVVTEVTCLRVRLEVECAGKRASGWGETPLSVQWCWPGNVPYLTRLSVLKEFSLDVGRAWAGFKERGDPVFLGHNFQKDCLLRIYKAAHGKSNLAEPMPWLAALIVCSAFDLALHDSFGMAQGLDVYQMYDANFLSFDLSQYLEPARSEVSFKKRYPSDYLLPRRRESMVAWHLVGGLDPLEPGEVSSRPADEYPVLLTDWIQTDGLRCVKIKLRGNDYSWDYERIHRVGAIARNSGVIWLSLDFNCTVEDPGYVNQMLDQLRDTDPGVYGQVLYVEQPFPYELEANKIDVRSVSARKSLFLDESAHDWKVIRLGRELGWSGVALKTCKTQTEALLSGAWAQAHGMLLMVQDLTNPMLAQISHLQLAAHLPTIMGVETNSMQFIPEASLPEAAIHPGIYQRRNGQVNLSTVHGPGFGYRLEEIARPLPPPAATFGD